MSRLEDAVAKKTQESAPENVAKGGVEVPQKVEAAGAKDAPGRPVITQEHLHNMGQNFAAMAETIHEHQKLIHVLADQNSQLQQAMKKMHSDRQTHLAYTDLHHKAIAKLISEKTTTKSE